MANDTKPFSGIIFIRNVGQESYESCRRKAIKAGVKDSADAIGLWVVTQFSLLPDETTNPQSVRAAS